MNLEFGKEFRTGIEILMADMEGKKHQVCWLPIKNDSDNEVRFFKTLANLIVAAPDLYRSAKSLILFHHCECPVDDTDEPCLRCATESAIATAEAQ